MHVRVVEGISGVWFYHLREAENEIGPALCGAQVMSTGIPVSYWGKTPENYHIKEKWCSECAKKAGLVLVVPE